MAQAEVRTPNRFLSGNYAPVDHEVTVNDLPVTGALPHALTGSYIRTGPNPLGAVPDPYHWFIGDGMVHAVELREGRAVAYRNRWVRTGPVAAKLDEAGPGGPEQPLYDVSNTNVVVFAHRLLSLTEGCYPYELTSELGTVARWAPEGGLPHGLTAHPKVDPQTGDLHGFAYWFDRPYLLYHTINAEGRVTRTTPIELPAPVSMHDFAVTRDHVLFFDQPAVFEPSTGSAFPFRWKPENGARVGVLSRTTDDLRWYESDVCYCFHPLNAYDCDNGDIVVDVPRTPSVYSGGDNDGPASAKLRMERWTLPAGGSTVVHEVLDTQPQEFCRIDERRLGSHYRYGYTIETGVMPYDGTRVFKHDLDASTRTEYDFGPGRHPGEFLFVADPSRDTEDGGWLVGLVHDEQSTTAELCVLDAEAVDEGPLATVDIGRRVPYGFHGTWLPGQR